MTSTSTSTCSISVFHVEYGRHIHPCKGCVSTAMPLCHWPARVIQPRARTGTRLDERDLRTMDAGPRHRDRHSGYWYQVSSGLKLMIDRLVCDDGGNPDPTSTGGKTRDRQEARNEGWSYPKHLSGRATDWSCTATCRDRRSAPRALGLAGLDGPRRCRYASASRRYIGYYDLTPPATMRSIKTRPATKSRNVGARSPMRPRASTGTWSSPCQAQRPRPK